MKDEKMIANKRVFGTRAALLLFALASGSASAQLESEYRVNEILNELLPMTVSESIGCGGIASISLILKAPYINRIDVADIERASRVIVPR